MTSTKPQTCPARKASLLQCLAIAGTQAKLAEALGCSQAAISKMIKRNQISVDYVLTAERIFGIDRADLRPDIYPPAPLETGLVLGRFHGADRKAIRA